MIGKCGDYTYMGLGRLFVPSYIQTDLNWEIKYLFRQFCQVAHCILAP